MQKQFKLLDEELLLNNITRISDPIPKPANSFFRAISISIFNTHNQTDFVKSIMKLTLQANCEAYYQNVILKKKKKHHIAFPIISQSSQLVKKYVNDKQMLETYFLNPDLECFQNDNYELASFTFNRRVSIFYINKDGYLNETLISCCRNKRGKKIMLGKVGKRYFAVEKESSRVMGSFIREYLIGNLINRIVNERGDKQGTKVHFNGYDEIMGSHKKFPKIHKKSLSQCGQVMKKLQQFGNGFVEQIEESFQTTMKNNYDGVQNRSHQEEPKNLQERDFDFEDNKDEVRSIQDRIETKEISKSQEIKCVEDKVVQSVEITEEIEQDNNKQVKVEAETVLMQQITQQVTHQQVQEVTHQAQTNNYAYGAQLQYGVDGVQTAADYTQMPGYYHPQTAPYMYQGYPINQYYSSPQYSGYYNMQQMMYDSHYYPYYQQPQESYTYSQPQELLQNNRYRGRLKFYDSNGKYGFIIVDSIGSDLFVHYDDLSKAGITKEQLQIHSGSRQLRFEFTYYEYEGKSKKAKKAIDLQLLTEI